MHARIKEFIEVEENINLIDQNNWKEIYEKAVDCLHPNPGVGFSQKYY